MLPRLAQTVPEIQSLPPFEEMEKEWSVVTGRRYIIGIVGQKSLLFRRRQDASESPIIDFLRQNIMPVEIGRVYPREIDDIIS
jgi:hypothetical protein